MGSLPLRGGRLPCCRPRNTRLHLWKYEQRCDRCTRQMARTHANPLWCQSSLLKSYLYYCWWLLLHHSSEDGKESNFGVWSWTLGKVARSFSHSDFFHYLKWALLVHRNGKWCSISKSGHHSLGDTFVGSHFHPFGEVIDGHQDILMPIRGFWNHEFDDVHSPSWKRPWYC